MHGSVRIIQTFLEFNVFLIHFLNEYRHLTKDVGVQDGREDHHEDDDQDFISFSDVYFVEAENHDGVVTHTQILFEEICLEQIGIDVNEVYSWNPGPVEPKSDPEEACQDMDVEDEKEDHLGNFVEGLRLLGSVERTDDF